MGEGGQRDVLPPASVSLPMTVRLDQEPHIVIASLGAVPEFVYDRLGQFEFRGLINQCRYNVQSNTV